MDAPFVAFGVAIDQCWGMDKPQHALAISSAPDLRKSGRMGIHVGSLHFSELCTVVLGEKP